MDIAPLQHVHIAVVVPAYEAERAIAQVLASIPRIVRTVIVVADGCRDGTVDVVRDVSRVDPRVVLEVHEQNRGVGAATRTGYVRALALGADVVVKMDADGQMDPDYLPNLVLPIVLGQADYAKGNRFLRPRSLRQMPRLRMVGNVALSFMSKISSGYWNVLDPTNGYTAISREALSLMDLEGVDERYFFESSMLVQLGLIRAVVADVPLPSRYGDEESHLSLAHSVVSFTVKHTRYFVWRMVYRYLLTDFSPVSLLLLTSVPLTLFGTVFGMRSWLRSVLYAVPATAGTVMLAAFTTAGGLLCLLQAMIYDIMSVPQRPISPPRLRLVPVRTDAGADAG
jgi:glycosyltransferase involved in cell wall biosynthesis